MSLNAALALPDLQPARAAAAAKAQGARGVGSASGASSASGAPAGPGSFSEALDDADRRADEAGSADRRDDDDPGKTVTATTTDAVPNAPASTATQDTTAPASTSTIPSADAAATITPPETRAQTESLPSTGIDAAMLLAQGAMAGRDAAPTTTTTTTNTTATALPAAASLSGVTGVSPTAGASKPAGSVTDLAGKLASPSTAASGAPSTAHGLFELPPASATQRLADRQDDLRAQLAPMLAARNAAPADVAASLVATEASASLWSPRAERGSERASDLTGSPLATPGSSGTGAAASPLFAPVDASNASASADGAGMAERMVEQVSWWLSQKTQGAEMTLDMANGQSVSVSVQVQGNEAQVAFRSDQADMRQMLTQAESQLKDLLGGQGLTLAGMSVGTQSGNAGQAQQQSQGEADGRRDAHSSGRSAVAVASDAVRPAGIGMRAPSGRSLDLYV